MGMRGGRLRSVFNVVGRVVVLCGMACLVPAAFAAAVGESSQCAAFLLAALAAAATGLILVKVVPAGRLYFTESVLACGMSWGVASLFAAVPFVLAGGLSPIDAFFEAVSGLTTSGITVYTGLDNLPRSLLLWRALMQWIGGLGILTLFLAITSRSSSTYFDLFAAESHKVESSRPVPGVYHTVLILWSIYLVFTFSEAILLRLLGMDAFDSICHALTNASTGGFSTHDASIGYFERAGFVHHRAIEYVMIFFMFVGAVSYVVHFKIVSGRLNEVKNDTELRWYIVLTIGCVALVWWDHLANSPAGGIDLERSFRWSLFSVVSIFSNTGYTVVDIGDAFFPSMSRQVFLVLMIIGGCVGSTTGGVKLFRIIVLMKAFAVQVRRLRLPRRAVQGVVVNGRWVPDDEVRRIGGLFFGWLVLLLAGSLLTAAATGLGGLEAASGMFSALGNVGPCYIPVEETASLPVVVKLTYVFGMLAGRLEILPMMILFSRKAWR